MVITTSDIAREGIDYSSIDSSTVVYVVIASTRDAAIIVFVKIAPPP